MPIITVALYSGRSQREKDRLAEAITEDTVKILKVEKKDIIVLFEESSHGNGMHQVYVFNKNIWTFIAIGFKGCAPNFKILVRLLYSLE